VSNARKRIVSVDGLPEMPIAGLRLTDVTGSGAAGLSARDTDGLQLQDVDLRPERGPAISIVRVLNARVAVLEETIRPGETAVWSSGHPSQIVWLTDGALSIGEQRLTFARGDTTFEPAGVGPATNNGPAEVRYARIEFAGKGLGETWGAAGLSPNYKLLFENPYTRVYDIRIPAGTKEPQHTHHDRVVVCLSGAQLQHLMPDGREEPSTLRTGEIVWRRGGTHIGQNLGKSDLWVIAVEPK
jgi:quercetin dioxygenase-like cupin family protein